MDKFKEYKSIPNHYNLKFIEAVRKYIPPCEWVATEKIHGANFSITTDGTSVLYGKRSSYLGSNSLSIFYNSNRIQEKYEQTAIQLFHAIKEHVDVSFIRIYGEICGGGYQLCGRHNGIFRQQSNTKMVQKEIQYSPDNEFIAFDIYLHLDQENYSIMNVDQMIEMCKQCGLPCVDILHRGSFEELLLLNPVFLTTIPQKFYLPPLEDNFAEGFVIRPNVAMSFPDKDPVIFKLKSPKFTEKAAVKKPKEPKVKKDNETTIDFEPFDCYINQNRVNSVLSKLTEEEKLNSKKVCSLVIQDILREINEIEGEEMKQLLEENKYQIIPHWIPLIRELL